MIEIPTLKCLVCGAGWQKRTARPLKCPRCGSLYWEDPSKMKQPRRSKKLKSGIQSEFRDLKKKLGKR